MKPARARRCHVITMKQATHVDTRRFRNGRAHDVVQHTFKIDPVEGHDTFTVSMTNDRSVDPFVIYLGDPNTYVFPRPHLIDEWEQRDALYACKTLADVIALCGYECPTVGSLVGPPSDAHLRRNYTFRPGDTLIATNEASDLGLAEGTRVAIVAISGTGYDSLRMKLETASDETGEGYTLEASVFHPGLRPARYRWTVEIEIAAAWVADGIDLTSDRTQDLLERAFPHLRSSEIKVTAVESPDAEDIAREQGYISASARKLPRT